LQKIGEAQIEEVGIDLAEQLNQGHSTVRNYSFKDSVRSSGDRGQPSHHLRIAHIISFNSESYFHIF